MTYCSAGAGRSGTFIGYDILFEESQTLKCVDVFTCVSKMRSQRTEMVQNCVSIVDKEESTHLVFSSKQTYIYI